MDTTLARIREKVDEFSKLHHVKCKVDRPRELNGEWVDGRLKGCYAILNAVGDLLYIGCGAARTSSMGKRLNRHIRDKSKPDGATVVMIATDPWYCASSLEAFLIDELHPTNNKVGRNLLSLL